MWCHTHWNNYWLQQTYAMWKQVKCNRRLCNVSDSVKSLRQIVSYTGNSSAQEIAKLCLPGAIKHSGFILKREIYSGTAASEKSYFTGENSALLFLTHFLTFSKFVTNSKLFVINICNEIISFKQRRKWW